MVDNDWMYDAACRGADIDVFFGDSARAAQNARGYCRRCPVTADCLALALEYDNARAYGVYAGLTGKQRDLLRARPELAGRIGRAVP